jgi:lipopolysaccharide/colanic/teichoic acid biosynthesis glycosyltransferase
VLKGDMSWVGPRPDVPGYADLLKGDDRIILQLKPGVTGPATLKYKQEDALLLKQENPLAYNDTVIWPDKVAINKAYIQEWSLQKDIKYLLQSVFG